MNWPINLLFIIEGERKTCHDKQKLKQYMTTKPVPQKILRGILYKDSENKHGHGRMGIIKSQEKSRQLIRQ
jgi:hypothetical protein